MGRPLLRPVLLAALVVVLVTGSVAASGYAISATGSIDTPSKTVTLRSTQYTVSSVAQVDPGGTLTLHTDGPSGSSYRVYVYNDARQVVASRYVGANDSGTVSFNMSGYDPGSYVAAVYASGRYQVIQPVVVAGYRLSVSFPDRVDAGTTPNASVSVTRTAASGSPTRVEVVLTGDGGTERVNATGSGGSYTAAVPLSGVSPGDYRVYAVARGNVTGPNGRKDLVALATPQSVTVTSGSTTTASGTGGTGGGGRTGGSATTTTTDTSTASTTAVTTTSTPTRTPMPTPTPSTRTSAATSTGTTALQPNLSTSATHATTDASSPDRTPFALGIILLLGALAARVHSD